MKTASYLRMFIVAAAMIAIACDEDEIIKQNPKPKPGPPQVSTQEYYTTVTTWQKGHDGTFTGIVTQLPTTDLDKATLYWLNDGKRVWIDTKQDVTKLEMYLQMYDGYMWASRQNNIVVVKYVGKTQSSTPPFPFDMVIVY